MKFIRDVLAVALGVILSGVIMNVLFVVMSYLALSGFFG